jgi:hypothetical protein
MRTLISAPRRSAVPLALATLAASAALPSTTGADTSPRSCIVPNVVGVSLEMARHALAASGCRVRVRELPSNGPLVAPEVPDGRQIVARQSPASASRARKVTVWLKPLCAQSAAPGPTERLPAVSKGPTELVSGLFLRGGPLVLAPRCRTGRSSPGTIIVTAVASGRAIRRTVRSGRFAIFPLKPGRYVLQGSFATASVNGKPFQPPPRQVTIEADRTTRLNVVAEIP